MDAQEKADAWLNHYSVERPHSALANLSPDDIVRAAIATAVERKTDLCSRGRLSFRALQQWGQGPISSIQTFGLDPLPGG